MISNAEKPNICQCREASASEQMAISDLVIARRGLVLCRTVGDPPRLSCQNCSLGIRTWRPPLRFFSYSQNRSKLTVRVSVNLPCIVCLKSVGRRVTLAALSAIHHRKHDPNAFLCVYDNAITNFFCVLAKCLKQPNICLYCMAIHRMWRTFKPERLTCQHSAVGI